MAEIGAAAVTAQAPAPLRLRAALVRIAIHALARDLRDALPKAPSVLAFRRRTDCGLRPVVLLPVFALTDSASVCNRAQPGFQCSGGNRSFRSAIPIIVPW